MKGCEQSLTPQSGIYIMRGGQATLWTAWWRLVSYSAMLRALRPVHRLRPVRLRHKSLTTDSTMKIAVVGAGAMGSVYAGLLAEGGNEVRHFVCS